PAARRRHGCARRPSPAQVPQEEGGRREKSWPIIGGAPKGVTPSPDSSRAPRYNPKVARYSKKKKRPHNTAGAKTREGHPPPSSRWRPPVLVAAGAAVVLAAAFGAVRWARPTRPNLLLVTIDTLRADHVGVYGAAGAQTPTLDGLARRGVMF